MNNDNAGIGILIFDSTLTLIHSRWDHDMSRTQSTPQSLFAFLMRPAHYPWSNNYKSNAKIISSVHCAGDDCDNVEMILREREDPKPWPLCSARCCHLGADISIVPVMDNDSYYAASMTTNDSHSPRYQWSQWRSQNIDDQEPMTFNSLPDPHNDVCPGDTRWQSRKLWHKVLIWSLTGHKSSHRWLTFVQIDDFQTTPLLVVQHCSARMDFIYF